MNCRLSSYEYSVIPIHHMCGWRSLYVRRFNTAVYMAAGARGENATPPARVLRSARSRGIMKNRCIAFLRAVIGSERGQCANNNLIHRGDLSLASSIYGAPACGRNRARPHIHSGSSRRRTQISCRQIPVNGKFFLTPRPNENMRIVLDLRMKIVLE